MTNQEAKQHLSRKLDIDYSNIANNGLWTDTDLGVLIQLGLFKAWDFKPWPFTQLTETATSISTDYYDHPSKLMNWSIYLLRVGGYEFKKVLAEDYLKYKEDYPTGTLRIWAEIETYIFVNKYAYTVGDAIDFYGKKFPITLSATSDLLPFSPTSDNYEHSGNEAIVQLAYAEALDSEKMNNPNQAEIERKKAYQTLDILWKPFSEMKSFMQSQGRPMFNVPDYFGNGKNIRSSGAYTGNFNYLN
jgi:hypothetical protein